MTKNLLTEKLLEPHNGATAAKFDIHAGDGNLIIDCLTGGEPVLASGQLQYFEKQGLPKRSLVSSHDQVTLTLKGGRDLRPRFHFPWSACNGATEWQIHLNPTVASDITAHTDGGNVKLKLAGMTITRLLAETGGGNVEVVLPENAANLSAAARTGGGNITVEIGSGTAGSNIINAKSGAGNVVVRIPRGIAARIHAATGLGKVIMDPLFSKTGDNTYQSSDFESAVNKVELLANSGAGNVIVNSN
jgi:hypothetical protein